MSFPRSPFTGFCIAVLSLVSLRATAAEASPSPPDYLAKARAYADTMIQSGRDMHGTDQSPLFAAALDRQTLQLGTRERFGKIEGVRETDRSIGGANPQVDVGLYRILFALAEVTGEARYAREAERALEFFFTHCQSPATGLMAWGEHLYWDFATERWAGMDRNHEVCGEWPFWEQCYRLAPDACWKFAIGQWDHQIADQSTGDFSRHAQYTKHGPQTGSDFPRYAGQMIINWADAWVRPENARRERRHHLIDAITCLTQRMEDNMRETPTGLLPALRGADYAWPTSNLELARCLWKAAPLVEREHANLARRLRAFALRQDESFLAAPHQVARGGGFAVTLHTVTGQPRDRAMNRPYTAPWATGYGYSSHASPANLCHERWEQLRSSHPALAARYHALIVAAANQYLTAEPASEELQKPDAFAEVINLLLNAHTATREARYLRRAEHFGRLGCTLFLGEESALPKASNRHAHYETITGGPEFMWQLLELHRTLQAPAGRR